MYLYLHAHYLPSYLFDELEWCSRFSDYSMGYTTEEMRFNSSKKRDVFITKRRDELWVLE